MATEYSGGANLTDIQYIAVGNKMMFMAKYSAPDNNTAGIEPGFQTISYAHMDSCDDSSTHQSSLTTGGFIKVYFSGHAAADTGYIRIMN